MGGGWRRRGRHRACMTGTPHDRTRPVDPREMWLWFWMFYFRTQSNTLRPRQNGRRFADDTFKRIFLNENVRISIKISLKFVPKGPINNNPALVQIMAWRRSGDQPLSEPLMVSLLTHIYVARPHWVKGWYFKHVHWNCPPANATGPYKF